MTEPTDPRILTVEEIARMFDVPLHLIDSLAAVKKVREGELAAATEILSRYELGSTMKRRDRRAYDRHVNRIRVLDVHLAALYDDQRRDVDGAPVPDWGNLRRAIVAIQGMLDESVAARGRADGLQVYVRETLEGQGLTVTDPDTLYVGITFAGLMVELAHNGLRKGEVDEDVVLAVARIAQTLTAALIPYLPEEARS